MSDLRLDAQNALIAAKRALERIPLCVADGFARAVRRAPDTRLEQLMRTPVRRVVLEGIFRQIPQHLVAKQAYFSGRIRLAGDIMLAARLGSLFHIATPDRRPSRRPPTR